MQPLIIYLCLALIASSSIDLIVAHQAHNHHHHHHHHHRHNHHAHGKFDAESALTVGTEEGENGGFGIGSSVNTGSGATVGSGVGVGSGIGVNNGEGVDEFGVNQTLDAEEESLTTATGNNQLGDEVNEELIEEPVIVAKTRGKQQGLNRGWGIGSSVNTGSGATVGSGVGVGSGIGVNNKLGQNRFGAGRRRRPTAKHCGCPSRVSARFEDAEAETEGEEQGENSGTGIGSSVNTGSGASVGSGVGVGSGIGVNNANGLNEFGTPDFIEEI